MRKIATAALLLILCLLWCTIDMPRQLKDKRRISLSQNESSNQVAIPEYKLVEYALKSLAVSSEQTDQKTDMEIVFEFLENHVEIENKKDQDGFSYMVNEGEPGNPYEGHYLISIGINSAEKFTATEHYYIDFDFSKIIKANPLGEDIVMWTK